MIKIDYDDREVLEAMRDVAGVLADAVERAFDQERAQATSAVWALLAMRTIKVRGGDAAPHSPGLGAACGRHRDRPGQG
ncbi:MAG: hypothetical protein ACOZAP_08135 [Pseudomonadota bacterium]